MRRDGEEDRGVIVVDVDSSDGAAQGLRFALEEAKLRGATLRVVHAWQFGNIGLAGLAGFSPAAELDDLVDMAESALDAILEEVAPDTDGVPVERQVVEGPAATVLVDESRNADLLVVGSRGYGGFAGLLLGYVSKQCAHDAACPVAIVRPVAKDAK
jgi:nucleotide-binding universal stress UspA family protein